MFTAFKHYLSILKLGPVSRKLYLSDVRKFLDTLGSEPTLDLVKNTRVYTVYLDSLKELATAPSMLKRTLASLKQFGAFIASTYALPNPTLNLSLSANHVSERHLTLNHDYIKRFTN